MLATLNEVLATAEEKKIAIGAFNAANLESLQAIVMAAEELNLPVIMQFAQCHEEWVSIDVIGPVMIQEAKRAKVPVCIHLDHGEDLTYVRRALELGFTSVMYDGSTLPYEENLKNSIEAVKLAKRYSANVEAELGSMGKREYGDGDASKEDETKIYTDPDLAKEFVEKTGIDALACSFGTTHGIYLKKPKLDFEVIKAVRQKTNGIPVVMHGGSGVSREDYKKSIEAGVRKINYFTYMDKAGGNAVADYLKNENPNPIFFSSMSMLARSVMKDNIIQAMKMFANLD